MGAILWVLMMLVWLAGLLYGLWWVWPLFERMTLTADLVMAAVWLIVGPADGRVRWGRGDRIRSRQRGDGRPRTRMEPSRRGVASACGVVRRPSPTARARRPDRYAELAPSSRSFRRRRRILPEGVFGIASTNSTSPGTL